MKFKRVRWVETETDVRITYRVTWRAPRTDGVEIRLYGVTECLSMPREAKADTSGPCLVPHTPLPKRALTPIATVPASAGKVTWTWRDWGGCDITEFLSDADAGPEGEMYYAVVLAAHNASGNSVFAIAWPGGWWMPGEGDMPC